MQEELFEALCTELDFFVLSTVDGENFCCLSEPPYWFKTFYPLATKGETINGDDLFPFLQNFLYDAKEHWIKKQSGLLKSGYWIEQDKESVEWPLEATAIRVKNENLLLLSHIKQSFDFMQIKMQQARNELLVKEQLELEVYNRTKEIRVREEEIAIRLVNASGFRDEETGMHIRRIGLYSAAMAKELGWPQTKVDEIKLAAPMHDVGKIGIADDILKKPGRLTAAEFSSMKEHARIGYEMLAGSNIPMLDTAAIIAHCHHEKFDGTGYPNGLKGEEIPIQARIVAIVDVYDALTHKRVYKEAYAEDQVFEVMKGMAGSHLDEELYNVFLSIIDTIRDIKDQNKD
jgi:response regulator RpfG family c-di-GMP phosphodiesterase